MADFKKKQIWLKPLLLLLIIGGITLILYETGVIHFFMSKKRLLDFLDSLGPFAFIGFILLQVLQVVAAPVPGEVTGILGGYLYGPLIGVILSTIGLTMGSYCAFALARAFGRPFVERVVDKAIMSRFDYLLHHKGAFLVFLLFLIPGFPKDYLCYILGLGHLSTTEFLVIGGTGRLFGTILLTLGGTYIRHHQYGRFFVLVGIALLVVLIAMAYRDKLERLFRIWHIIDYKKKKSQGLKRNQKSEE
ncbi:MAG: TVP38/TMEM64 family protein [Nitrospirae bacterium]|nr:TVP38/TMEM64 family protein [Nitrospirota bacterium]